MRLNKNEMEQINGGGITSAWVNAISKAVGTIYELGRQTLLMEKIIAEKPCNLEVDNFLHIVVIPEGNTEMRNDAKCFRNTIKKEWRDLFTIVSPEDFLSPVNEYEPNLICYLSKRYWD